MIGHIHQPKIDNIDGINYYNTGDFVESCSYIIEDMDGNIELRFV
jgi:UDP-2,3-diacylglucosamine pyrophosphatase LpxH